MALRCRWTHVTPITSGRPVESNRVNRKAFQAMLKGLQATGLQAEFPLRRALTTPSTTVYTNHFVLELGAGMLVYEYDIKGLPERTSKRISRIVIQEIIDALPFLQMNPIQLRD
jgi:eukaryotic translation initiation factor 2C